MRHSFIRPALIAVFVVPLFASMSSAQAQTRFSCYGLLDLAPAAMGLEGACSYGSARVSGGVFTGMYHPRSIEMFRPNVEGYGFVDVSLWGTWHASLYLGAGWTEAVGATARSFLVITNPGWSVAPWANLYGHTDFTTASYAQIRAGVRVMAGAHAALVFYGEIPFTAPLASVPLGVVMVFY